MTRGQSKLIYETSFPCTLDEWTDCGNGHLQGVLYDQTGIGTSVNIDVVSKEDLIKGAKVNCKHGKIRLGDKKGEEMSFIEYKRAYYKEFGKHLNEYGGMEMVYNTKNGEKLWYIGISNFKNPKPQVYSTYHGKAEEVLHVERLTLKFVGNLSDNVSDNVSDADSAFSIPQSEAVIPITNSPSTTSYTSKMKLLIRENLYDVCTNLDTCNSSDYPYAMALVDHHEDGAVQFYLEHFPIKFASTFFVIFNNDPDSQKILQDKYENYANVMICHDSMEHGLPIFRDLNMSFGVVWLDGQKNEYADEDLINLGSMVHPNGIFAYTVSIRSSNRGENADFRKCRQHEQYHRLKERGFEMNKFEVKTYTGKFSSGMIHVQGQVTEKNRNKRKRKHKCV